MARAASTKPNNTAASPSSTLSWLCIARLQLSPSALSPCSVPHAVPVHPAFHSVPHLFIRVQVYLHASMTVSVSVSAYMLLHMIPTIAQNFVTVAYTNHHSRQCWSGSADA